MKKVLHVVSYYNPHIGGIEQVAQDCVTALKGKYEQRVVCFNHEKGDARGEIDGVEVVRAGCFAKVSSQSLSFSFGKILKKEFRSFAPDLVIFHYPNPFIAHSLLPLLKKSKCKFVLWWHLDIIKQKILRKFFHGQTKALLNRADKVVATSPNYIEGSPYLSKVKEKCTVISCCVNDEHLRYNALEEAEALRIREQYKDKTILLALGRHIPYKGIEYLVKASALLDDRFAVLIGGEGPLTPSLKEMARKDSKIIFLGRLTGTTLRSTYLACDIFCFPSITKNEAFGIALAEAMYCAKPAVTFTIHGSGVNYVCINGETGIEVENGNVEEYAKAIIALADSPKLREKYGANGKARVESLFTQTIFSEKTQTLAISLL